MLEAEVPALEISRPALALLERLGHGRTGIQFEEVQNTADRPRTTITRYLGDLTAQRLMLRVRHNEYATPSRPALGQLLVEPNPYLRSVILYDDILARNEPPRWGFACVPIRDAFDVAIDRAIPVLPLDNRLQDPKQSPPYPEALWYSFDHRLIRGKAIAEQDQGPSVTRVVPTIPPESALSCLTATLDPRFMRAARTAARRLKLDFRGIVRDAKHLAPARPPLHTLRSNIMVFPEWLAPFWETSKTQHAGRALDRLLQTNAPTEA